MESIMSAGSDNNRQFIRAVDGMPASDGAGVSLLRVIGTKQLDFLDPFLMLDEFKNEDPDAYVAGFPDHPHRGFETVSYMKAGKMKHHDSVGNEGVIEDGGVQWMTAGRGIIHSEMPQQTEGLLWGYQLWVNLPAKHKMVDPRYQDIQADGIPEHLGDGIHVRLMAGEWQGIKGASQTLWPVGYLDVRLDAGVSFTHDLSETANAMAFVYEGSAISGDRQASAHQLGILSRGSHGVEITAGDQGCGMLFMWGEPIGEPVAKMGPFVMNTREELFQAADDFRNGRFA